MCTYKLPSHFILLFLLLSIFWVPAATKAQQPNAQSKASINLADPTIFFYDDTYYLYGTNEHDANNGFTVYTSTDLQRWEGPKGVQDGYALSKKDVYGDKGFWAPQVFNVQDTFYMAYTANEHIAIATSDSPLGPFVQQKKQPITAEEKTIDPYVFFDDDGTAYLYHVRLQEGNRIFVAEMTDDLTDIKPNTAKECLSAADMPQPWEDTQHAAWTVTEGPTVLKHQGTYYLFYSANDFRNPNYAVGFATADHPLGPWTKYADNPILSAAMTGENGSGHGDFFTDRQGTWQYVFHTHQSKKAATPRKTALITGKFIKTDPLPFEIMQMEPDGFRFIR